MEKQQVITFIESQLADGSITQSDLLTLASGGEPLATSAPAPVDAPPIQRSQKNLVNVFYGIGAIIVLTGIVILVAQHWTDIGFIGRLLVTAGIAIATYIGGLFLRNPGQRVISQTFFTIAAALAPLSAYVVLSENNVQFGLIQQLVVALGVAVLLGVAWALTRRNVLVVLGVFYLTWAYYAAIMKFFDVAIRGSSHILTWATIVAGIAYVLIGYGYKGGATEEEAMREEHSVRTTLYGLGTLAALAAGISLGGIWDLVYIVLLFAVFYLSVFLKTRTMLVLAALFLIGHLIHLTSKYFVDSIGWPIALVISGFLIIGIGYATYYVMKRFIR